MTDIRHLIEEIFETDFLPATNSTDLSDLSSHISAVNSWLEEKLCEHEVDGQLIKENGRLGPARVVFDSENDSGMMTGSPDHLTIQSQSAFSTSRANVCVFSGKWMYEVQLRSKGVMQLGWCSAQCRFTQDTGVGDTRNSYGLDGSKQRIWHVYTRKYGPYWRSGDIFGICLDMDSGRIEYYRNGVSLGEAFNDVERGPGVALFPAVSLAFNDSVSANFGGSPFRHPVAGYKPLQQRPKLQLVQANYLIQYLVNLARIMSQGERKRKRTLKEKEKQKIEKEVENDNDDEKEKDAFENDDSSLQLIIAAILVEKLAPLLKHSYVVEDKVFSYIKGMCVIRSDASGSGNNDSIVHPGQPESILGTFLSLLWTFMDEADVKSFVVQLINYIGSCYKETPIDLEYEKQRTVIVILTCICNHPETRRFLLETKFFERNCLPLFLYIKPPDESALERLLPDDCIWTEGLGGNKLEYNLACDRLKQCTAVLYTLQKNLILMLMNNSDGDAKRPSSRKLFVQKFRKYVMENSAEHRNMFLGQSPNNPNGNSGTPTQPAVALSFLSILLDVTRSLFHSECPDKLVFVKPQHFYDDSFDYHHFDRVGGILSHLKKTFRRDLVKVLGEEHPAVSVIRAERNNSHTQTSVITFVMSASGNIISRTDDRSPMSPPPSIHFGRRGEEEMDGNSGNGNNGAGVGAGPIESYRSLNEMLDCAIFYYYAVAHKYIVMIADLRDNIAMLSNILLETKSCSDEILETIETIRGRGGGTGGKRADMEGQEQEGGTKKEGAEYEEIMNEMVNRFGQRKSVFAKRSMELARKQAWYRSVALGAHRRNLLCWLLGTVFETLDAASCERDLFSFVPETYINVLPILLDTVLDFSFHDIAVQHDLKSSEGIVAMAAEFLAKHSADPRVVFASCKDALLQALGTLTCHEAGIRALERTTHASQMAFGHALLRAYQNRAWGQSNWLLLRFWLGDGFAYREARATNVWQGGHEAVGLGLHRSRGKNGSHTGLLHHIAPACPSKHFQRLFRQILLDDEPFCTMFLNSVLSQLNWAFSEFITLLQEIQASSQRATNEQQMSIESRQLKICSMCFELTVSLMRSLEMVLAIVPEVVLTNSDVLLGRIVQLVSQVLSRVTIPPGCFQHVIDLCLPDLSSVSHFSIITAALGILLALVRDELLEDDFISRIPRVTKLLLMEPSFQIGNIEYTLGEVKTPLQNVDSPRGNFEQRPENQCQGMKPDPTVLPFSLKDYPCHISSEEIAQVAKLIRTLQIRQSMMSEITILSDDSLCPICYAKGISAEFYPCKHQSCSNCILQHMINSKVCFYCKTLIVLVRAFDGTVLYENSSDPKLQTTSVA